MQYRARLKVVGYITVECEADDEFDAEETFLMMGEDIGGEDLVNLEVEEVEFDVDEEDDDD